MTQQKFDRLNRAATGWDNFSVASVITSVALMAWMFSSDLASAETPVRLSPDQYGQTVLKAQESLGSALHAIKKSGHAFEPIGSLLDDDPIRAGSRRLGRLDILQEKEDERFLTTCTATLLDDRHVLTNHHCVADPDIKLIKVSLLLDFFSAQSEAKRIELETAVVQADRALDFALVRTKGSINSDLAPMVFTLRAPNPGERLRLIHHPAGQPKMLTQFKCSANRKQRSDTEVAHRCDSLPGSSGGLLFDANLQVIGLHHSGGLNDYDPESFNVATRLGAIIKQSEVLSRLVAGSAAVQTPVEPKQAPSTLVTIQPISELEAPASPTPPQQGDSAKSTNDLIMGN